MSKRQINMNSKKYATLQPTTYMLDFNSPEIYKLYTLLSTDVKHNRYYYFFNANNFIT